MICLYWLSKPLQSEDRTMHDHLREDQIEAMTQALDEAIEALDAQYGPMRESRQSPVELLSAAQHAKLEQATGETAAQFWQKFKSGWCPSTPVMRFCRRHTTKYALHKGRKSPDCLADTVRRMTG